MTSKERQKLESVLAECDNGRYGMEKYTETLEDPYVCTKHFDKIEKLVNSMLGGEDGGSKNGDDVPT